MYREYVSKLCEEAQATFNRITTIYPFEHGNEFEAAIYKFLKIILPKRYSVCKGYIVSKDDTIVGDDIIIYDAQLFPKVRVSEDDFFIKQHIPAEAVYAYIEAKNTIDLSGNDLNNINNKDHTFLKALSQVSNAKNIIREQTPLNMIDGATFNIGNVEPPRNWPKFRNPMFGVIFARNVKNGRESTLTENDFIKATNEKLTLIKPFPDLIIAGENIIGFPVEKQTEEAKQAGTCHYSSPFLMPEHHTFMIKETNKAIGVGIISLLSALNYIRLMPINYDALLSTALNNS